MDEQQARAILDDAVQEDGSLYSLGHYMCWNTDERKVTLDCEFSAEELEAIVWFMRNKQTPEKPVQPRPLYVPPVLEFPEVLK
jgi:hypothetical protein